MKKIVFALSVAVLLVSCQAGNNSSCLLAMPQTSSGAPARQDDQPDKQMVYAYAARDWEKVVSIGDRKVKSGQQLGAEIIPYAVGLDRTGRKQEAVCLLQHGIKEDPLDFHLIQTLGNIYMYDGEYASADSCYNRVIELNPTFIRSYLCKGDIYSLTGDSIAAATFYLKGVRLLAQESAWKDCVRYASLVINLNPDSSDCRQAWILLGAAHWHLNQTDLYEKAHEMVGSLYGQEGLKQLEEYCK